MMHMAIGQVDQEKILADARERGFLICYGHWFEVESAWQKECAAADLPAVILFLWHNRGDLVVDPVRPLRRRVVESLRPLFSSAAKRNKCRSFACDAIECSITIPRREATALAKQVVLVVRNMKSA